MRKLFGFFIVLVAMVFLGLAYTEMAHAEDPTCDSVLAKKIIELHESDASKILELQLELTSMKLAKETLTANAKTAEAYMKKQEALIQKLDDDGVRTRLVEMYREHGILSDATLVEAEIKKSAEKISTGSYFKASTRFKNKDLSAYVLAQSQTEEGKKVFNLTDASILWYQAQISEGVEKKTSRGSAAANQTEVSTRVAQLTGVAGTVGKTGPELDAAIAAQEKLIGDEFDRIMDLFDDTQKKACSEIATCKDCEIPEDKKQRTIDTKTKSLGIAVDAAIAGLRKNPAKRDEKVAQVLKSLDGVEVKRESVEAEPEKVTKLKEESAADSSAPKLASQTMEQRTDALILKMKAAYAAKAKQNPMFLTSVETEKNYSRDKVGKLFGDCPARYLIEPIKDNADKKILFFSMQSRNGVSVCRGQYHIDAKTPADKVWSEAKVSESCRTQEEGVDVDRACANTGEEN